MNRALSNYEKWFRTLPAEASPGPPTSAPNSPRFRRPRFAQIARGPSIAAQLSWKTPDAHRGRSQSSAISISRFHVHWGNASSEPEDEPPRERPRHAGQKRPRLRKPCNSGGFLRQQCNITDIIGRCVFLGSRPRRAIYRSPHALLEVLTPGVVGWAESVRSRWLMRDSSDSIRCLPSGSSQV